MDTILIIGGSGFLGGYFVKKLEKKYKIVSTFHNNHPRYSKAIWERLNLRSPNEIRKLLFFIKPNTLIHCAAISDVDFCEMNQSIAKDVNFYSTEILSSESQKLGARFLFISTDQVFSGADPPYAEFDIPDPINFYGWTKRQAELSILQNCNSYVIIRTSILYGRPAISGSSFSEQIKHSLEFYKQIELFTDQIRTPIYAGNLVEAVIEISNSDFSGVINIAGSERITKYHMGLDLAELLHLNKDLIKPVKMSENKTIARRPIDVSLNTDLAKRLLKSKLLSYKKGILNAYLNN